MNQTPLDWQGNKQRLEAAVQRARQELVSLPSESSSPQLAGIVVSPELSISGYGCEDSFLWPETAKRSEAALAELLPATQGLIAIFGLPFPWEGAVYNCAAICIDGKLCGLVAKQNLARSGIHYEPRFFQPWPAQKSTMVECCGVSVPLGDIFFSVGELKFGLEICEDAWVENRPAAHLAACGVQLILNPSASHFEFGKHEARRELVFQAVKDHQLAYAYVNLLGNEAGRAIYDGDAILAEWSPEQGALSVAETQHLSFCDYGVLTSFLQLMPGRHPPVSEARPRSTLIEVSGELAKVSTKAERPLLLVPMRESQSPGEIDQVARRQDAFGRVIALALFDYLRKTRSRGFVVSLSGGADSATVLVLCRLAVRLAIEERGFDGFCDVLSWLWDGELPHDEEEAAQRLITSVYQATENSSNITRDAATAVAAACNSNHHEVSVQEFVSGYTALASSVIGRPLSWATDDLALQNIQARARSPGIWLIANLKGALLLSTSNRSEAAVGYATMDGDTSGGISPIAGIGKPFIRSWLIFMERLGFPEWRALQELAAVNAQQPTAELRPSLQGQTDEGDLMPYEVLDFIETQLLRERRAPREILRSLESAFPEQACEDLARWCEKFFVLFTRNQWKRERYAVSFHVDEHNLDPRGWFRFPVLSGGLG
ncbi:MAG: NAD(+) synthase [Polyangiaceae bacterium]|nr:NAD(+) synthase [Polyangiaceae bacterium]